MRTAPGSNHQDVKVRNRLLVLRLIATNQGVSRVDLAKLTGLTKMTIGNIVSGLLASGVVAETETAEPVGGSFGRRPVLLKIAPEAPCICGMLIKRGLCQVVLAGLDGAVFAQDDYEYASLDSQEALISMLRDGYRAIVGRTARRVIAVGISSVGPIDAVEGIIRNPPYFYGIENVPITSIMEEFTSLPTFLINDANAGALAENLFGIGRQCADFVYLHIMNGAGAGLVLQGSLYNGDAGVSGEIGHTSISFSGPKCACGNTGCLDLYASLDRMCEAIRERAPLYPDSPLCGGSPGWLDIVDAGNRRDPLALSALDEFCAYIAYALVNTLNILDLSTLVVGYDSRVPGTVIETILLRKISGAVLSSKYRTITVTHSFFGGSAPLVGAIAEVANRVFIMQLPLQEIENAGKQL